MISLFHGPEAGLDHDDDLPFLLICEGHGRAQGFPTLTKAIEQHRYPDRWCEFCKGLDQEYVIEGAEDLLPFTLEDFLTANAFAEEKVKCQVLHLDVGERLTLQGEHPLTLRRTA